jgi:hypothetical protein
LACGAVSPEQTPTPIREIKGVTAMPLTPVSDTNRPGLYRSPLDFLMPYSQVMDALGQLCDIF